METLIMGILNYTPDSFSDGGKYFTPSLAAERAREMQEQGADITDVGCNSTRPGSEILGEAEELARLKKVLPAVKEAAHVPVSVDTFYPECARFALENGAEIINDVSGEFNRDIAALVKEAGAKYIVTHNPCGADATAEYPGGVVNAVREFFEECIVFSNEAGIPGGNLWLDPGFGFGKSREENFELLANLSALKIPGYPLLAGISRKRFIRDGKPESADFATDAANTVAGLGGADIIRVHNVPAAVEIRRVAQETVRGKRNG
ncbi:MAG: dihydropteroate synthase [Clostridia bacterium]|nr:dihydropteroate synthase [Clostridia bacterium]